MDDDQKTSEQLIGELAVLRQRLAALEVDTKRPQRYPLAWFHRILMALTDAEYAVDTANRMTFVNLAFETRPGHAERGVTAQPALMLYTPEKGDKHHYRHGDTDHA